MPYINVNLSFNVPDDKKEQLSGRIASEADYEQSFFLLSV